jgi:hypothetical protein
MKKESGKEFLSKDETRLHHGLNSLKEKKVSNGHLQVETPEAEIIFSEVPVVSMEPGPSLKEEHSSAGKRKKLIKKKSRIRYGRRRQSLLDPEDEEKVSKPNIAGPKEMKWLNKPVAKN